MVKKCSKESENKICIFNIQHACDFRISTFTRQTIASKEMGQNNSRSQANKVHSSILVHTFVC